MELTRRALIEAAVATGTLLVTGARGEVLPLDVEETNLNAANPFLQGNFAPVYDEITADRLKIVGKLPPELNGMFVRNGPNPQMPPLGRYHWFDGDGMLHGIKIRDGKASYLNRYVRTEGWQKERAAGKALYTGLAEKPDMKKLFAGQDTFKNAANIALLWHNGKFLALWEGGSPHEIGLPDLSTKGAYNFDGGLKHAFTAHPRTDPKTGELICFGYSPGRKPYLHYSVISPQGKVAHTTPIDLPHGVMMHDFAITENYTLFMDLPLRFDMAKFSKGEGAFHYKPEIPSRFGVLPRHETGDKIRWFEAPPCFVFHTLNAWEEGDEIVLVACRYDAYPDDIDFSTSGHPVNEGKGGQVRLHEWRFNLKTGATREKPLDDTITEFPRINTAQVGRKGRYGYASVALGRTLFDGYLKYDLLTGKSVHHKMPKGIMVGEGVFVPKPGAKAEDDGWLIGYGYDKATNKSEFHILDAQNFSAAAVARVLLPVRVPYGLHGTWLPGIA